MAVIDINSLKKIDCAEDIHKVISATLGGVFELNADGSFTLEPWPCGLTPAGLSFIAMARGRRFSNLLSVIAIIMDGQVGIETEDSFKRAIRHELACPFCGQVAAHDIKNATRAAGVPGYCVECKNCGARGPGGYADKASARAGWAGLDRLPPDPNASH